MAVKFAAVALLALLAVAFVAQADALVGHTSCYTQAAACAVKTKILTSACMAKTLGSNFVNTGYPVYGCACFYFYAFATQDDHDAYQSCEKTGAGKPLYATIKSQALPTGITKVITY